MTKKLHDFLEEYGDVVETVSEMSKNQDIPFVVSEVEGINFDQLTKEYFSKMSSKAIPKSNDSVIHHEGIDYFIEFKSGQNIKRQDLYTKIRDSLLTYLDIIDEKVSFTRENVSYILVHELNNFNKIDTGFQNFANKKIDRYSLKENFEGLYFKRVDNMYPEEFKEKFEK